MALQPVGKRGDSEAMLAYLRTKYGIPRLLEMPMQMVSAALALNISD